jgi:hypothetical protein
LGSIIRGIKISLTLVTHSGHAQPTKKREHHSSRFLCSRNIIRTVKHFIAFAGVLAYTCSVQIMSDAVVEAVYAFQVGEFFAVYYGALLQYRLDLFSNVFVEHVTTE